MPGITEISKATQKEARTIRQPKRKTGWSAPNILRRLPPVIWPRSGRLMVATACCTRLRPNRPRSSNLRPNARFICCVVYCRKLHVGLAPYRRNRSKNNRITAFLGEVNKAPILYGTLEQGAQNFLRRGREGSLFISLAARGTGLLIRRQVLQRKKGPIEHSSRF